MKKRSIKAILGAVLMVAASTSAYMVLSNYLYPVAVSIFGEAEAMANISSLSLIFTFAAVSTIAGSLLMGKLLQKFSVRLLNIFAIICFVAFFAILAFADSVAFILAGAVLFGLSMTFGGFGICMTIVSWWADVKIIGRAMSALTIGLGVFSFISSPVVAGCIQKYGRVTALYHGLACGVLMLIAALFLISGHPGKYAAKDNASDAAADQGDAPALFGASLKNILRTAPFWLLMGGVVLINIGVTGFTNNAATFYQTLGVDSVKASYGISAYSVGQLFWSYLFGWLTDKKGPGISTLIHGVIGIAVLILGTFLGGISGVIFMGAFFSSVCFSGSIASILCPQLYGTRESGTLIGWGNAAASVGTMVGAPVAAGILGATGSFNLFLILDAVLIFVTVLVIQMVASRKTVERMNAIQD